MHTLKQLCIFGVLWTTGSAIVLPHLDHYKADSTNSKSKVSELPTRNTTEWLPVLQSRGDTGKEPAIRRHSLARSFSTPFNPHNALGSQHSGTKRDHAGTLKLPPLIPTPTAPSFSHGSLRKGSVKDNHGFDDADRYDGSRRTRTKSTSTASRASTSGDSITLGRDRHTTHTIGKANAGIDRSDQVRAPAWASSETMPPPPPKLPFHIVMGYPAGSNGVKSQPAYGYPMVPPQEFFQHYPPVHKEPGSDLESYMIRRSVTSDLPSSVSLTKRGSSLSSLGRHGSPDREGPMVRGTNGPDRAAQTNTNSFRGLSRPYLDVLSLTHQYPLSSLQMLIGEAQRPPPPPPRPPPSRSDWSSSHSDVPRNGRKSRSASSARSSHMKRSSILPRTPGKPANKEHKPPPPPRPPNRTAESPPRLLDVYPPIGSATWLTPHFSVTHRPALQPLGPGPVGAAQSRNPALRVEQAPNGLRSMASYEAFHDVLPIQRPGTPFVPLSPSTIVFRAGSIVRNPSGDSSPERSLQSQPTQPSPPRSP